MRGRRRFVRLVGAVALAGAVAGCGHGSARSAAPVTGGGPSSSGAASVSAATPTQVSTSSGPPAPLPTPTPTVVPAPSTTAAHCLPGGVRLTVPTGGTPPRAACVRVGGTIRVSLDARGGGVWGQVTSSAPGVVQVQGVHPLPPGSEILVARALAPGTAVLRAVETDTSGARTSWALTVTVVG